MSVPFRAIHYFAMVARRGSFSKAAEELFVSQSAVSHQIKLLEERLGQALFIRKGRQLLLTAAGEAFYQNIEEPLAQIEREFSQLQHGDAGFVRLASYGSLAVKWLIPAVDRFRQRYPNVDLTLTMLTEDGGFERALADCFITTQPPKSGFEVTHLYDEYLYPYCSYDIRSRLSDLRDPSALLAFPLLSATYTFAHATPGYDWKMWFKQGGVRLPSSAKVHHFSHLLLAAEAAKHSHGVALLNEFMTTQREREQELVRLPMHGLKTGDSFYFVVPSTLSNRSSIQVLRDWLVELCQSQQAISAS